jgi:hypothetical protein
MQRTPVRAITPGTRPSVLLRQRASGSLLFENCRGFTELNGLACSKLGFRIGSGVWPYAAAAINIPTPATTHSRLDIAVLL